MSNLELKIASFKPGMELKVKGVPKPNATRFAIIVGHSKENITLYFDVRFNHTGDQRVSLMNSRKDGQWQVEVRDKNFPFQWGQKFEVTIIFADNKFYINLHDGHVLHFPNRLADNQYDYISIEGEVTINGIYIN